MKSACTSHVERQNGTLRQWCKRLTRLTYASSKKWENLHAALALHFAYYNSAGFMGSSALRLRWKRELRRGCGNRRSRRGVKVISPRECLRKTRICP
jgi:hypothetical protein